MTWDEKLMVLARQRRWEYTDAGNLVIEGTNPFAGGKVNVRVKKYLFYKSGKFQKWSKKRAGCNGWMEMRSPRVIKAYKLAFWPHWEADE